MSRRVSLFIDYQNAYGQARDLFHQPDDDPTCGQFRPWALGEFVCRQYNERHPAEPPLELNQVQLYRGEPVRRMSQVAYDAFQRQRAAWEQTGVQVFSAPLQYDQHGEPQAEKEIDVQLAIDFVIGAVERTNDVGVLFSFDRDLLPALRYVRAQHAGHCRADVAGWGGIRDGRYLSPPGQRPVRHLVGKSDYQHLADATNYTKRTSNDRRARRQRRR